MEVLSEDMITRWILPHLPIRTGGRRAAADPAEVVGAICYKLKPGCQWRRLPVKVLFTSESLSWHGVYLSSRPCSRATKPVCKTSWSCTGWPSPCCYCVKLPRLLSKRVH